VSGDAYSALYQKDLRRIAPKNCSIVAFSAALQLAALSCTASSCFLLHSNHAILVDGSKWLPRAHIGVYIFNPASLYFDVCICTLRFILPGFIVFFKVLLFRHFWFPNPALPSYTPNHQSDHSTSQSLAVSPFCLTAQSINARPSICFVNNFHCADLTPPVI
jgi:hypothetical protein